MVYRDPGLLAKAVVELERFVSRIIGLRREICEEVRQGPSGTLCKNRYVYNDRELGAVHEKLLEAEAILQKLAETYRSELRKAVVQEMIEEKVNEYIKLARLQG